MGWLTDELMCKKTLFTNADRIRAMSDEELAVWMNSIIKERNIEVTCDGWLAWLKHEAEEGE